MLLFFIVGDILGGGIYALVGEVGDKVGGAFWTAFAAAGVVAAFTAASYRGRAGAVADQLSSVASTVMLLTPASAREMMQPSLAVFAAA